MHTQHNKVVDYTLVVFLVAFSWCSQLTVMAVSEEDVHASIKNRLGDGRNLTLHCRSKDDDLGPQNIGLVVFLVAFSWCSQLTVMAVSEEDVHASIKNRLGDGRNLTLHCRSKDDDLGPQNIGDGSEFGWNFSVNVWGTTLYYCDMQWERVPQYHFDAYSFARDHARCSTNCSWLVSTEGMYTLNGQTSFWEFSYYWPN